MEEEVDDADDEEAAGAEGIKEADEDERAAGASESEEAISVGMKEAVSFHFGISYDKK